MIGRCLSMLVLVGLALPGQAMAKPNTKAAAVVLPPVGERIYVRKQGDAKKPVEIQRREPSAKTAEFLRDPQHPDAAVAAPPPPPKKVVRKRPVKTLDRSKLQFRAMPIPGRLTEPRVQFNQPRVPAARVDRKPRVDFFDQIFVPTRRRDF